MPSPQGTHPMKEKSNKVEQVNLLDLWFTSRLLFLSFDKNLINILHGPEWARN